jgi:hypothetical protein
MSPPKPTESPEANFYHILTLKNPRKKLQEAKNHTEATRKKPTEKKQRSAAMQRASQRSEAQAGFRHRATHCTRETTTTKTTTRPDPTRPDRTKPRVISYAAAENESNHKRFFLFFSGPPLLFPWGYFKRI